MHVRTAQVSERCTTSTADTLTAAGRDCKFRLGPKLNLYIHTQHFIYVTSPKPRTFQGSLRCCQLPYHLPQHVAVSTAWLTLSLKSG